jgi:hypothetical protein
MKNFRSIAILTITASLVTIIQPCSGQSWVGIDNFSNGLSMSNWEIFNDQDGGQMAAAGTNGHVSFIVPISTMNEQNTIIAWPGTPAVSNDWTSDISGHNSANWSNNGASQLQLWLFDASNTGRAYRISMEGGSDQFNGYQFTTSANSVPRQSVLATNSNFGLRLVHRGGATGDIEAWYDPTGNGIAWTLLDKMSMVAFWPGVAASDTFLVAIISDTYYGPIAEGQIWADNFSITNSSIGSSSPQASLAKTFGSTLAVQPTFANLFVGSNYQLQVATTLTGTFSNYGSALTATNINLVYPQSFSVTNNNQLFFRLQSVP